MHPIRPRRIERQFSPVGDTVLDPFWGTGATTRAAILMHRSSIGYEIHTNYLKVGINKLGILPPESSVQVHGT
jgi:DNA modification methylase